MTEMLKLMAGKLGLRDDTQIISKASEYERLLKLKMCGTNSISDSTKCVICLDLAADSLGHAFDLELGMKLAAVKKSAYANSKHTMKKLLNIEEVVSINSLCVQLGCTKVCTVANKIFERFKASDIKNSDYDHPQFVCMAVYQACRLEKIKMPKNKFITNSHLKLSQWNELEAEWTKTVDSYVKDIEVNKNIKSNKKNHNLALMITENFEEKLKNDENSKETNYMESEEQEDYEVWKKRILKQAYKELELEKKNHAALNVINIREVMQGKVIPKINREKGIKIIIK